MAVEAPKRRMTQAQKTDRAFHAFIDLLDAADVMKARVQGQLAIYGLTMKGFRVLELLRQEGPMRATLVAERCRQSRGTLDELVRRLVKNGWLASELVPAREGADGTESVLRVSVLELTEEGEEFIRRFLPHHGKVVKAFMRALEGREQDTLSTLCRKLIEGDVLKLISEMEHEGT